MADDIQVIELPADNPTPVVVEAGTSPLQGAKVISIAYDGPGGSGSYDPARTFVQQIPQSVTTINHGLGYHPGGVSLFSYPDGATQYGEFVVQHLSANALRVSMDIPTSFIAYLS